MSEWIKKLTEKYSEVNEKAKLKMDPVGKADADIDNDGDVDKSDSYLHNRRKAISNAKKKDSKEDVVMNPTKKGNTTTAESKAWPIYSRIMEKKSEHTKNAAPADKLDDDDTLPGKGAKDMAKDIAVDKSKADMEKQGHDSVSAANRAGPTASGDEHLKSANKGDKSVVNPAKGVVTKEH